MNMIRFHQPAMSVIDQLFSNTLRDNLDVACQANIYENENSFVIEMAAPGYVKEDIHIDLEQQTLNITAQTKEHNKIEDEKYLRREFSYRTLNRSFVLPKSVDIENINADYENGILKITLPRKEESVLKKEIAIR